MMVACEKSLGAARQGYRIERLGDHVGGPIAVHDLAARAGPRDEYRREQSERLIPRDLSITLIKTRASTTSAAETIGCTYERLRIFCNVQAPGQFVLAITATERSFPTIAP
jgi:hypothetical protein